MNNSASCACLSGYEGIPPYCRPQCETNADCPNHLACVNERCTSPCINACGQNAKCSVSLHAAMCHCVDGLVGDPFVNCHVPVLYIDSKFSIGPIYMGKCSSKKSTSKLMIRKLLKTYIYITFLTLIFQRNLFNNKFSDLIYKLYIQFNIVQRNSTDLWKILKRHFEMKK